MLNEMSLDNILFADTVDIVKIRRLARRRGGFQCNELRKRVWPKLMGVNRYINEDYRSYITPHYRDDYQVWCDVTRLWGYLQPIASLDEHYLNRRRKHVLDIIRAVLCKNPSLYYYQGYHDVASTFFLVLENNHLVFNMLEAVTKMYLTDFMLPSFDTFGKSLHLILALLQCKDPELVEHFNCLPNFDPYFATSWVITWFAHDLSHLDEIARVYDVLLCSPPIYPYYLSTALLIIQREVILSTEAELGALHSLLIKSPALLYQRIDEVIAIADQLMLDIPIAKLVSSCSMQLKDQLLTHRIAVLEIPRQWKKTLVPSDWVLLREWQVNRHLLRRGRSKVLQKATLGSHEKEDGGNELSKKPQPHTFHEHISRMYHRFRVLSPPFFALMGASLAIAASVYASRKL